MILPNIPKAEEAVIGALLIEKEAFDRVSFLLAEMFYRFEHQIIYEAILSLNKADRPVDIITVTEELRMVGKLDEVGGPYYIAKLSSTVASSAHIEEHAMLIKQKYIQRRIIELSHAIQTQAYDDTQDVGDTLFNAGKQIESLQEDMVGTKDIKSFSDVTQEAYVDIERRISLYASGAQTGITTGLADLNRITSGWQNTDLVIIAARPAMGKTAIALHFAKAAAKSGLPVVLFSLEMSSVSMYNRLLLSECDISPENLKSGKLDADDLHKIDQAASRLIDLPISLDDNAVLTMSKIRSKCRLLHKKKKCDMVVIDYLQLITGNRANNNIREQEISEMSREAKLMAKELNIPVLLLSQLNREVEKRPDKRPQLSDLRESGAIEQDADMVMFIHRPEYYGMSIKDKAGNPITNAGELIIAKYRSGAVGSVRFKHNDSLTRIYDYDTRGHLEYIPDNPF